jgi:Uma2 family endonuclease
MGITEEDINNGFQRFITNDILSEEQYLERETLMEIRSEYQSGRVKLASQKSMVHSQITMTLFLLLNQQISESCQIFMLTLLVYLPKDKSYFYPDLSIVYDTPKIRKKTKKGLDALTNPQIIIEISDKNTAEYDMGEKMICYLKLKSLQQYIIVSSERKLIITYTKDKDGDFKVKTYSENEDVLIGECKIPIEKIFVEVV